MTSDTGPFRGSARGEGEAISVWFVPVSWNQPLALLVLGALFGWAISGEPLAEMATHGAYALALLSLLAVANFPLVVVNARIEGGHLIVSGRRWPGAQTIWSCTVAEAAGFAIEVVPNAKGRTFHRVAMRTRDGKTFALTEQVFPSHATHVRALRKLQAWWEKASG